MGRPALTADRWIPSPFRGDTGARIYRSGDRGRYRPDGVIDFLGRNDGQVKIRGYRIELAEIEAVLSAHPAVDAAAVLLQEHSAGEKRLTAYLVTRDSENWRGYLAARLPEYMVPASYVVLDKLPQRALRGDACARLMSSP